MSRILVNHGGVAKDRDQYVRHLFDPKKKIGGYSIHADHRADAVISLKSLADWKEELGTIHEFVSFQKRLVSPRYDSSWRECCLKRGPTVRNDVI